VLNRPEADESVGRRQRLEMATRTWLKWLKDLPEIRCRPVIEVTQPYETHRLGRLLNGGYALFEGPALLSPLEKYPVNYVFGHSPPFRKERLDTVSGSEYQKQLYLGYAPPSIDGMDGYAVSLNQLLTLEAQMMMRLDAEEAPDIQLPYYLGFPDLASGLPAGR
jgi:hypothetical protein